MRIIFAGTPDTAVPSLKRLHQDHEVLAVLTRAPAPVGRKRLLTKSALHAYAEELGLPVLTPASLREDEIRQQITELAPDAVAVVAYGLLIPPALLDVPRHGWLNLHFSLLPRWRGAAPVQYAIANEDAQTGTSVFQIEEGLDTGPVFDVEVRRLTEDDTAGDLLATLAESGANQLARVLSALEAGEATSVAQTGEATLAPRLSSYHTRIDWSLPASRISAQTRGWWPAPGAWTTLGGTRVKLAPVRVTEETLPAGSIRVGKNVLVGTGTTAVELGDVGPSGKSWMSANDWARGIALDGMAFDNEVEA
ncbi:methionyl-tRNA formyltransferase [Trueperella pecoris]|uniref:Methionyl-tRNA formyltransferase n=1 Tax=Trueperella pecoris TaxID=2733571 RepID=A0A7M1R504_9ACTO|nr:methionyl-tRNA formyltransferase [Trueperella pecoris]QOR48597.1 methionyl-tRNA formyltransferase [Trueperella pecoris]